MLKSENRLKKRKTFNYLYNFGSAKHTSHLTLIYLPVKAKATKIGFTISKKVGKAHTRNLIKRRLRAILMQYLPQIKGVLNLIFVAKINIDKITYKELDQQVKTLLAKADLL